MAVEQVASGLDRIIDLNAEIEWRGSGYGGFDAQGRMLGVAEGPVWWKEGGYLLFSDNANNKRYKWAAGEGVTLFKEPTGNANGLTRDPQGRLIACEHATRRVTREEPDGSITVVADNYHGLKLNRPNDVVVKSDGAIYFTDPVTLGVVPEVDIPGVYRISPDLGTMNLLARDFATPNGLVFTTDESVLYVNDSARRLIRAFTVESTYGTGILNLASDRVFIQMSGPRPGAPDGMKVDTEGNVYCTGPGGVWIMDSSGNHLGVIAPGEGNHVTNMGFGGDDWSTLFLTTFDKLARIPVKVPGIPVPRGPV